MPLNFERIIHPHIAARKAAGAPKVADEYEGGFNARFALILTRGVGTMWGAYVFGVLALVALPDAIKGGMFPLVQWLSQTFIQLVMLSVIMVGQNILGQASDKRADLTYKDTEATFHEAQQIQEHLKAQDEAMNTILDRMEKLEAALIKQANGAAGGA